ncbi:hypothetical protein IPZ58_25585 [Streptomyces roseoverticillatus]|uniref:hypothetical protein n=1 Tax=Streptomyces roseoverticillatus TaxID=66429 RepID=UPI001F194367|nr:hypothetical protein [Streptomyces roseoverticillatus]MCF3104934.1 hypothetical protein [Streptomyces roseoverticillatus]
MREQRQPARTARPRHYLMCRPTHFAVDYCITPWTDPAKPVGTAPEIRHRATGGHR